MADSNVVVAGWTPLHYAAIFAPPTLISYLMTHGCSLFSTTERNLTPLDIVTAHSILPGKEDVVLLLEESMRSQGWTGGIIEEKRRRLELLSKRKSRRKQLREDISRILDIDPSWWKRGTDLAEDTDEDSDVEDEADDSVFVSTLLTVHTYTSHFLSDTASRLFLNACFLATSTHSNI